MIIPTVTQVSKTGKEAVDILSLDFVENRTIYLFEEITDSLAVAIIAQLKYLDSHGSGDITLMINSPGGSVSAGMAIYDTIQYVKCDVSTICTGIAASMGAFLLSAGTKGKRFITPSAEVMIHQPLGGVSGQASDIELTAKHILKTNDFKRLRSGLLHDRPGSSRIRNRGCHHAIKRKRVSR